MNIYVPALHGERPLMSSRISINPDVCNGKPVIRGTRILGQTVMEFLGTGDSIEDVLEAYPSLTREDIDACIRHSPTEV